MSKHYNTAANPHNGLTNRDVVALEVLAALIARANASLAPGPLVREAFNYTDHFFDESARREAGK